MSVLSTLRRHRCRLWKVSFGMLWACETTRTIRDVTLRDAVLNLIAAECVPCFCIVFGYVVQWRLTFLVFDTADGRERQRRGRPRENTPNCVSAPA
jgi:hypothetical protein